MKKSDKKRRKPYCPKYYNNLELPICRWNEICKTGELKALIVSGAGTKKLSKPVLKKLNEAWENICDQHYKKFGWMYRNYVAIKEKEKLIIKLICKKILKKDESIQTFIDIAKFQLKGMNAQSANPKDDFMQSVLAIEKNYHFQIDEKNTSTDKFYSYITSIVAK